MHTKHHDGHGLTNICPVSCCTILASCFFFLIFWIFLFDIFVKFDVASVLNKLAAVVGTIDRLGNRSRIILVIRTHHTFDVRGGLDGMVEGHLREQMVAHVGVCLWQKKRRKRLIRAEGL